MRRFVRALVAVTALLLACGVGVGLWARGQLRASLPLLDGSRTLQGLSAPVTVTRDALGIPTITGASRKDVARATGFLHAQDRFFQMDLARRRSAGELAALVGPLAFAPDRAIRRHRFRSLARRAVAMMDAGERALLDAYTAGVNRGLSGLRAVPFEYLLLRQQPEPWLPEDSLLVVLTMFITLQDTGRYESTLATMHDVLPREMFDFLAPAGTEWDAPVIGEAFSVPPVPGPEVYDVRARRPRHEHIEIRRRLEDISHFPTPNAQLPTPKRVGRWALGVGNWALGVGNWELGVEQAEGALGSNNWAVAGSLSADGGAIVANDMHLNVSVPNIWYRASLEWRERADQATPLHRLIGLTLPGVPSLVAGSNTHIAWGFTNTWADWSDLVILETDPQDATRYRTPQGWQRFERHDEVIEIAGEPPQRLRVDWTIWGPVVEPDHRGRMRALRWVAHDAERLGVATTLETAVTVEGALDAVNGLGTPGQNFVVADRLGHIGWTIYGSIPRRTGLDGRLPASWADGSHGWNGWLALAEYPRLIDPEGERIWTANARVVDGEMLAKLGDSGYDVGSRARIVRDRLMARDRFTPRDMLDIQLDTSAEFLARWRELILQVLTPDAIRSNTGRGRFREIVEREWDGQASPGSAGYRLTRTFREEASDRVANFMLAECYEADPAFDYAAVRRREGPIWKLVSERPMHMLDPQYRSWDDLLLAAIDAAIARASEQGGLTAPWSRFNVTGYRHPLSSGVPLLGRWLDMSPEPLGGDLYTPRMHWRTAAASERMVVSPGREADGFMHMPTGQSGHPLSPFYANSHPAWVDGEPTSFLPGPAVHTLTLTP